MSEKRIPARVINKNDIETNWILANDNSSFTPLKGEIIIYNADENYNYPRIKIGDGVNKVSDLAFFTPTSYFYTAVYANDNGDKIHFELPTFRPYMSEKQIRNTIIMLTAVPRIVTNDRGQIMTARLAGQFLDRSSLEFTVTRWREKDAQLFVVQSEDNQYDTLTSDVLVAETFTSEYHYLGSVVAVI